MARPWSRTDPSRAGEAGVTLVEVLVVLALIGTVAGAVGLGLGPASRGPEAREEAQLLAARMRRASEEALLAGQAVALVWSEHDYRFLALGQDGWGPHPVPLLGEPRPLPGAIRFENGGGFAVTAAALPAGGSPLALRLEAEGGDPARDVLVVWDGATVRLAEPEA